MKKKIIISLAAVMLCATVILIACLSLGKSEAPARETFFEGDIKYSVRDDGKIQIEGYAGNDSELVIPSTIGGKSVLSIADGAFAESDFISVTLGSFITHIGEMAFAECNSLKNVYLNDELISIGAYAFYGCGSLDAFDFPSTVTHIGQSAFFGCNGLSYISLPSGVTEIPTLCFAYCTGVTFFKGTQSLTKVSDYAFYGASGLKEVQLGAVETVGDHAFDLCEALVTVDLGSELSSVGEGVFYNCDALAEIKLDSSNTAFTVEGGALVDIANKRVLQMPVSTSVTSYTFPRYVESVAEYAFRNVLSLTEVVLSPNLKRIETYGFYFCDNLARIVLPDSAPSVSIDFPSTLTEVGGLAFERCNFFTSYKEEFLIIGDGVLVKFTPQVDSTRTLIDTDYSTVIRRDVTVSGALIKDKIMGIHVQIPTGVKVIASAFSSCNSIVSVSLPETVSILSDYAFYQAAFMESVDMSFSSVKYIGDHAFDNCKLLSDVVFPQNTLIDIGSYLFMDCYALESISIPESLTYIGEGMFAECTNLSEIKLHGKIVSIGARAFNSTTSLTRFDLPSSVKKIGDYAFNLSGIVEFTLPAGVKAGEYLFLEATSLKKITVYGESVSPVGICMGATALEEAIFIGDFTEIATDSFYNCTALKSISIPSSVTVIGNRAFQYCKLITGIGKLELSRVGDHAFYNAKALSDFRFTKSLTTLGKFSFYGCEALAEVDLRYIETAGESCFENCLLITEADLRSLAYEIPDRMFSNCVSLSKVTVADTVTDIGSSAFMVNRVLSSIELPEELVRLGDSVFMGCESLTEVKWNGKLRSIGDKAFLWCDRIYAVALPDSVEYIGESAFEQCHNMTVFSMGDNVKQMGPSVFKECYALKDIRMSSALTTIEYRTFSDCTSLEELDVPEGITTIDSSAFSGCSSLYRVFLPTTLNNVMSGAFLNCSSLAYTVYSGDDAGFYGIYIQSGNDSLLAAYHPKG